jgi:hypothetical protein
MNTTARDNVRESWGEEAPDWVLVLAEQCDRASQKKAGADIHYSSAVVNQVLKKSYAGDLTAVEKAVRGAYLNATVECPILGDLALHHCLQYQRAKFSATNQMRVRLYRACRNGCAHSKLGGGS